MCAHDIDMLASFMHMMSILIPHLCAYDMYETDLEKVVQSVVSSLEEAEEVVQSAIAAVAEGEGLTDSAKAELTEKLAKKAENIEESIKVADSVAKTAETIAIEDENIMSETPLLGPTPRSLKNHSPLFLRFNCADSFFMYFIVYK